MGRIRSSPRPEGRIKHLLFSCKTIVHCPKIFEFVASFRFNYCYQAGQSEEPIHVHPLSFLHSFDLVLDFFKKRFSPTQNKLKLPVGRIEWAR